MGCLRRSDILTESPRHKRGKAVIPSAGEMQVRIVQTPPGEAPIEVREAWVGLVLPLREGEVGPREILTQGVLSGPRTYLGHWFARLVRRFKVVHGFCVDGAGAVQVLA